MLYVAIATRAFRRYSTYRAATLAGIFTNSVFGIIYSFAYLALWEANPDAGGYDAPGRGDLRLARPGAADDRRPVGWRHHRRPRRADPHRRRRDRPLPAGRPGGLVPRQRPRPGAPTTCSPAAWRPTPSALVLFDICPARLPRRRGRFARLACCSPSSSASRSGSSSRARPSGCSTQSGVQVDERRLRDLLQRDDPAPGPVPGLARHPRRGAAVGGATSRCPPTSGSAEHTGCRTSLGALALPGRLGRGAAAAAASSCSRAATRKVVVQGG